MFNVVVDAVHLVGVCVRCVTCFLIRWVSTCKKVHFGDLLGLSAHLVCIQEWIAATTRPQHEHGADQAELQAAQHNQDAAVSLRSSYKYIFSFLFFSFLPPTKHANSEIMRNPEQR